MMKVKYFLSKVFVNTYWTLGRINDRIFGEIEQKFKGLDFLVNVPPKELGSGYDRVKYVEYVPSKAWQIRRVVKQLKIDSTDSIIDFGCGKGKALHEFSKYPFNKICGVELSSDLAKIAKKNMQKLNLDIEIHNVNALEFTQLDEYNNFYFYDPFSKEILAGVLDNIINSFEKKPREINVVYLNPRGHKEVLESKGFSHIKTLQIPMKGLFYGYSTT